MLWPLHKPGVVVSEAPLFISQNAQLLTRCHLLFRRYRVGGGNVPKLCAHFNKFQLKIQITQQLLVQIILL